MKLTLLMLMVLLVLGCSSKQAPKASVPTVHEFVTKSYIPAVGLMYAEGSSHGSKDYMCTATAFNYDEGIYYFISAGHCVTLDKHPMSISPDSQNPEVYYPAAVMAYGDVEKGEDFSVLGVAAPAGTFTTIPLGHNPINQGEEIFSISAPNGIGKVYLSGIISMVELLHHSQFMMGSYHVDWQHNVIVQLSGSGPGSSGSAIVCKDQMKVCGILVGSMKGGTVLAPIERFEHWWTDVQCHKTNARPDIPILPIVTSIAPLKSTISK